jgi:hypothetical protein
MKTPAVVRFTDWIQDNPWRLLAYQFVVIFGGGYVVGRTCAFIVGLFP